MFIALNPITKVSVIRTWSEVEQAKVEVNVTEVGEDNNDEAWGDLIFKEEAPLRPVTLNLEAVFNEVANQVVILIFIEPGNHDKKPNCQASSDKIGFTKQDLYYIMLTLH